MMGRIRLNIDSADMNRLLEEIEITESVSKRVGRALTAGAEIVVARAKALVPVRSGRLHDSLKVGRRKKTRDTWNVEAGSFYDSNPYAPHAHLVEYGHGGPRPAPPHAFLNPAMEDVENEVNAVIMEELMKGL